MKSRSVYFQFDLDACLEKRSLVLHEVGGNQDKAFTWKISGMWRGVVKRGEEEQRYKSVKGEPTDACPRCETSMSY